MDSLSQIALGAAVSVAVFRRRQPLWQSALLGGGTWPPVQGFRGSIANLRAILRVSAAVAGCFAKAGAWRRTRGFDAATKVRKGLR